MKTSHPVSPLFEAKRLCAEACKWLLNNARGASVRYTFGAMNAQIER